MRQPARLLRTLVAALALFAAASVAAAAAEDSARVTFFHVNDLYRIAPDRGQGGVAPLMTLLQRERMRAGASVTTLGGDLISPSLLSGFLKGAQMIALTNAIGLDLAVLGNHEFDFGPEVLERRLAESKFAWLAANVESPAGTPYPGTVPWLVREMGGFRIGFLGLLTPSTGRSSSPGPGVVFGPVVPAARRAVAALRKSGAEAIVALTHLPIEADRELARAVPGIDLILGGHDHDPISFYEGGTLILKSGHDAHYLGVAELRLSRVKAKAGSRVEVLPLAWRYLATAGVPPEPAVARLVAAYEGRLSAALDRPAGTTATALDSRADTVRTREAAIGNLIADAMRTAVHTDVALMNGGGIRGGRTYPAGTVLTGRDVFTELPFGNLVLAVELTGAELRRALAFGVAAVARKAGRFLQVSGLRFAYEAASGRIAAVTVGGQPLEAAARYRVAVNDYMRGGGDGYEVLAAAPVLLDARAAPLLTTVVIDYLKAKGTVAPRVEGRIRARD